MTSTYPWQNSEGYIQARAAAVKAALVKATLKSGQAIELPSPGVTVLVGGNNAGKSTLLRQLNFYLQSGNEGSGSWLPSLLASGELEVSVRQDDFFRWLDEYGSVNNRADVQGGPYHSAAGNTFPPENIRAGVYENARDGLRDLHSPFVQFADAQSRLNASFVAPGRSQVDEPANQPLHRFQDNRSLFDRLSVLAQQVFDRPLLLDDFPGGQVQIRVGRVDLPIPARDEPLGEFGRAVAALPVLGDQGDGMKSFFGLMIPLLTDGKKIVLVDEPEAFLHPPQARALGRELGRIAHEREMQVIVATHDKDLIAGLLEAPAPMTVIRLTRTGDVTDRAQLASTTIREVWDDRTLRYSNVLDGLFSQLVVICESEQDCRFYEAALDYYVTEHAADPSIYTIPSSDVLFVPSNGKAGFLPLLKVLHQLSVPTAVIPDLDLLRAEHEVSVLFAAMDGNWSSTQHLWATSTSDLRLPKHPKTTAEVKATMDAVFEQVLAETPGAMYDKSVRSRIDEQLRSEDPWAVAKQSGVTAFRGNALTALRTLISEFDAHGIVLVEEGELEGFARQFPKNSRWLPQALTAGAHLQQPAQSLVRRFLDFHQGRTRSA